MGFWQAKAAWHPYTALGVLLTFANEADVSSSAWCAGIGTIGNSGARCPNDDAAGPCPAGCEVRVYTYEDGGGAVPILASVAVVLAVAIAIGFIAADERIEAVSELPVRVPNPLMQNDGDDTDLHPDAG